MSLPRVVPGDAEFPLNAWYVAAFSREVAPRTLLSRKICGIPMVMYRKEDGAAVALFDRCPHRGMPLSMGHQIEGDRIRCGYHGFEFDSNGKCVRIPSQDDVPSRMAVKSYALVEKWKWLWVWPGDPDKADTSLIPDHEYLGLEKEGWEAHDSLAMRIKANYVLPLENLIDATHISYLHHGMIDGGSAARVPYTVAQEGGSIALTREIRNEVIMGRPAQDRTLILETFPPHIAIVDQRINPAGNPAASVHSKLVFAVTPETTRSTHQFVASAGATGTLTRHGSLADLDQFLTHLLSEDVVAIEAIQQVFDSLGPDNCPEISQRADVGGGRARRIIAEMIARERPAAVD